VSFWAYGGVLVVALVLAAAVIVLVLLVWSRHRARNYWEE
jgi:hypothetical protein